YMSAVMGSRSANRGCCGQACRLPFSASGNKNAAALSLKDLSLLPQARQLEKMGVDSFKIEGRMKRPEYVASAVHELKSSLSGQTPDMQLLKGIFSRSGFTDGYFTGNRQDMFGVREKEDVTAARELIPKIHELYRFERKAYDISFTASIKAGSPVKISACANGVTVSVTGDTPEKALNRPTDRTALEKQLSKLGDTVFSFAGLSADIDEGLIVPAGKLNELRRKICEQMTAAVTEKNTPVYSISGWTPDIPCTSRPTEKCRVRVMCRTSVQFKASIDQADTIIAPMELLTEDITAGMDKDRIIISPPRFITDEEKLFSRLNELRLAGYTRLFCHTPDCIAIGRELGFRLHGSFTLNVTNSFSAHRLAEIGLEDMVCSFELTLPHLNALRSPVPMGAVIYGRLPLMLTRNCPIKNETGCGKCRKQLTDRTGRVLPVQCSKEYVEILNPDVLFMQDRLSEMTSPDFLLYILTDEDEQQTKAALSGRKTSEKITRGLYYRGI
ncbi:MAG: U32 family peptidase, partial [Ruminococcus sp.]|nr:U32 family peptidase [Ruminococcus sp.]